MCYLKNLSEDQNLDTHFWNFKDEESSDITTPETNVLVPCSQKAIGGQWNQDQQMLVKIFQAVQRNNKLILNLEKLLHKNSQQVGNLHINTQNSGTSILNSQQPISCLQKCPTFSDDSESLTAKLFGTKAYKFHLQTLQKIDETIYKQRNFSIEVRLVSTDGKVIRNCNTVALNFAMCTMDAKWLHENRVGEPFLKGKTQTDLYKGQASFHKMYARDVSRGYPQGKVAIVIYPKPSTLKYYSEGISEETVDSQQIQPLVIEDITIRAKRKM